MRYKSIILNTLLCIFLPFAAQSKTAKDILSTGESAEQIGLAIFEEADKRDIGFGDMEVSIEMVLRNKQGQESFRNTRNKTFEIQKEGLGDKSLIVFDRPRDIKGTAFLTFSKVLKPDDQWLYLPSLKRVKRISSKNKSGPFIGSEFAYEDISSQEVGKYKYKYLRSEDCGAMKCFVVERYPLYEHSGYTKQIVWIDEEEFRLVKIVFYDRKDALLKTLKYEGYKQYLDKYWRPDLMSMVNHQNGKSTDLKWQNYKFRTGLKESDFTKAKLKQAK